MNNSLVHAIVRWCLPPGLLCLVLMGCTLGTSPPIPLPETPLRVTVPATSPLPHVTSTVNVLSSTPEVSPIPEEARSWLRANAVPLKTTLPGAGCDDLQPLLAMIGDARLVALGEATHGTREFMTTKHRILECLVQEKGFNVLALEAGWSEANHIDKAVHSSENVAALKYRYPNFWGGSELWDCIAWIQAYNQDPKAPFQVSVRGFDMQFGDLIVQDLLSYVNAVDPGNLDTVQDELACFLKHVTNFSATPGAPLYSQAGEEVQTLCRQGLQAVYDWFLEHQTAYEEASSPDEFAAAFYLTTLLIQNEQLMAEPDMLTSVNLRDRYMAENVAWLLERGGPETKVVLSAHNGHVTPARSRWVDPDRGVLDSADGTEFIPMGAYLREWYGDDLVVVGFLFNQGSFWAIGFSSEMDAPLGYQVFTLPSPLPGSHESFLSTVDLPLYLLDLRPLRSVPGLGDWFREPRWMTSFGMGYVVDDPEANASRVVLPEEFDLLIYFGSTSELVP